MKVAVPALVAVIVVMTVGVFVTASSRGDRDLRSPSDGPAATREAPDSGTAAADTTAPPATDATADEATEPSPSSTTTPRPTGAPTAPSAEPPPSTAAGTPALPDPLAACSPGQRMTIERGNHPAEWYAARFDQDGDGIFCT